jgi:hypothetical protein
MPIASIGLNCGEIPFTCNKAGRIGIQDTGTPAAIPKKQEYSCLYGLSGDPG